MHACAARPRAGQANLNRIMAECTGQPLAKIEEDTDRDRCGGGAATS